MQIERGRDLSIAVGNKDDLIYIQARALPDLLSDVEKMSPAGFADIFTKFKKRSAVARNVVLFMP